MKPDWETKDGRIKLYCRDCLEVLPTLEKGSVNAVVTDPPYGCDKAEWDSDFFTAWYPFCKRLNVPIYTITGSRGVRNAVMMVSDDFIDCIASRNLNGMTRGPIGFGNWLSCVVSNGKPKQGVNAFDFVIRGEMPDHPSPKPIEYMLKLIERVTEKDDCVCDPMIGSGTTAIACIRTGRRFIGCEIERKYFDVAVARVEAELVEEKGGPLFAQGDLWGK